MEIVAIFCLIAGVFSIISYNLLMSHYKQKYPEKEYDNVIYLVPYSIGIICILGGITGEFGLMILTIFIEYIIVRIYVAKKYEIFRKYLSFSLLDIIVAFWFIVLILTIVFSTYL